MSEATTLFMTKENSNKKVMPFAAHFLPLFWIDKTYKHSKY